MCVFHELCLLLLIMKNDLFGYKFDCSMAEIDEIMTFDMFYQQSCRLQRVWGESLEEELAPGN